MKNQEIQLQGENKRFFESESPRQLLVGATCVGKTFTAMLKIHMACVKYPGTKVLLARKSLPSLRNSIYKTYVDILTRTDYYNTVRVLGKNKPTNIIYNKNINEVDGKIYEGTSEISLSQIDSKGKALAANYNIVYFSGLDEGLTLDEFKLISSTARIENGLRQVIVDTNLILDENGERTHWIYQLPELGYEVFNPTHKDNPNLYNWTNLGREIINQLNLLPNKNKESLLEGLY